MGLGIGTVAEVAKQSLGGKRKGGTLLALASKRASAHSQHSQHSQLCFTCGTGPLPTTFLSAARSRRERSARLSSPVGGQRGADSRHAVQGPRSCAENRADAQHSRCGEWRGQNESSCCYRQSDAGSLVLKPSHVCPDNSFINPQLQKIFERVRQSADFMPSWQMKVSRRCLGTAVVSFPVDAKSPVLSLKSSSGPSESSGGRFGSRLAREAVVPGREAFCCRLHWSGAPRCVERRSGDRPQDPGIPPHSVPSASVSVGAA